MQDGPALDIITDASDRARSGRRRAGPEEVGALRRCALEASVGPSPARRLIVVVIRPGWAVIQCCGNRD
jgi:hypothetical protein